MAHWCDLAYLIAPGMLSQPVYGKQYMHMFASLLRKTNILCDEIRSCFVDSLRYILYSQKNREAAFNGPIIPIERFPRVFFPTKIKPNRISISYKLTSAAFTLGTFMA